jgi:type II secretory pathway pseudopilin PulG
LFSAKLVSKAYQLGFTFIGILMVIAISGIALAGIGIVWHQDTQRENEKELLFIGEQYRKAIVSYYENSPSGVKQYPKDIQDLLLDKRFTEPKRHIRKLYRDPITRGKPWGLIKQQGLIIGIYSTSETSSIKKNRFPSPYEKFSEAVNYQDWKFIATPQ